MLVTLASSTLAADWSVGDTEITKHENCTLTWMSLSKGRRLHCEMAASYSWPQLLLLACAIATSAVTRLFTCSYYYYYYDYYYLLLLLLLSGIPNDALFVT